MGYIVKGRVDAHSAREGEEKFPYQVCRVNTNGTRSRAWGDYGEKIL